MLRYSFKLIVASSPQCGQEIFEGPARVLKLSGLKVRIVQNRIQIEIGTFLSLSGLIVKIKQFF